MSNPSKRAARQHAGSKASVTGPITGEPIAIGSGFSARGFRAQTVGPAMDPLVMVDHYVMTADTFGTHPHAGLSAVSLILPDSTGRFRNRDSLGNDIDLLPGDLYWLQAGRGAVHNEAPRADSRIHGLQVFVNTPQAHRHDQPTALRVRQRGMPQLVSGQYRVRVALGESNGIAGASSPGVAMTILYGQVARSGSFEHELESGRNAWLHVIEGEIELITATHSRRLGKHQAAAVHNADGNGPIALRLVANSRSPAQFALFDGQAIKETYIQRGPFVMGSIEEIETVAQAAEAGQLGTIE